MEQIFWMCIGGSIALSVYAAFILISTKIKSCLRKAVQDLMDNFTEEQEMKLSHYELILHGIEYKLEALEKAKRK